MSTPLGEFVKLDDHNPLLVPRPETQFLCPIRGWVRWEEKDVFNPSAVVHQGRLALIYRAEDTVGRHLGTSRIGIAFSDDGISFERHPVPILHPDNDPFKEIEWEGGCEDPRVAMREDGLFVMSYTAYDGRTARLCIATSRDLLHWTKHGLAFPHESRDLWSKSGSVVCGLKDGVLAARRIGGKYWMLWGESAVFAATSDDMISWHVVPAGSETKTGNRDFVSGHKTVFTTRRSRGDSSLVEPGPAAVWTPDGIVLMYHGRNSETSGDPARAPGAYSVYCALLDPEDPTAVIQRPPEPFLAPDRSYEIDGQTNHVVFAEGLAWFKDRWWLYYGTADSKIAAAATLPQGQS